MQEVQHPQPGSSFPLPNGEGTKTENAVKTSENGKGLTNGVDLTQIYLAGKANVDKRSHSKKIENVLRAAQEFADELAKRPNVGTPEAPLEELKRMSEMGLFIAPMPRTHGGLGLGTDPDGHLSLLRLLTIIGGADLALGRLYEGHVNALILIATYGSPTQIARAAEDAQAGRLFGVWNTGAREPLRLQDGPDGLTFRGVKQFASGAAFVQRPVVTAEREGAGWQMTLPRMESSEVAGAVSHDSSFWHPLGMEASESFSIDFTGASISNRDLIGAPGDFYRDPLFRGGAIRFAAVQAGAVLRLHRLFADWLEQTGRGGDPYQVARLGEVALGAQEAVLWIERAASTAQKYLRTDADKLATESMIDCANMVRLSIERIASDMMRRVIAGVGAHGLLQPSRFERIIRDLTMYLRQPAPDQTLADVGRAALRKTSLRSDGAGNGLWQETEREGSLPPSYFQRIYERSDDPWDFQTSGYESGKYRETLASLPRQQYRNALEIGCSIGVLTAQLAARCGHLLSLDVSENAINQARKRCVHLPQVTFAKIQVPREIPQGSFDLVMVSEVAYYWQSEDLSRAIDVLAALQPTGGHLVLVHYTALVPDYPLTGDQVHDTWCARPEWRIVQHKRHERYRLDVLERLPNQQN